MVITVDREAITPCCRGVMSVDGKWFGYTMERPWLLNKNRISAIPQGEYKVAITDSPKFGRPTLEILGVPDRSGIRIHPANTFTELEGCIAVALHRVAMDRIQGSICDRLQRMAKEAIDRGEPVTIKLNNPKVIA